MLTNVCNALSLALVTILRLLRLAVKVEILVVWPIIEDSWEARVLFVEVVNKAKLLVFVFINPNWDVKVLLVLL